MERWDLFGCHVTRLITQSFLRHPWISTSSRDDSPTIPSKQLHTDLIHRHDVHCSVAIITIVELVFILAHSGDRSAPRQRS